MRRRLENSLLGLIFGSVGPLAFFAPKGMWLPILLVLLLRIKSLSSVSLKEVAALWRRNAVFLVLPVYAILSSIWAIVPWNAVVTGGKLLAYVFSTGLIVFVIDRMTDREKQRAAEYTAAGLLFAILCVWADLATTGAVFGFVRHGPFNAVVYSRGAVISACALLPLAVGLYRWRGAPLAILFAIAVVATVFVLANEASKVAIVLGGIVLGAVCWRSFLFWPVVLVPLFAGIVFPAFFTSGLSNSTLCTWYNKKPSAAHRLMVYEFTTRKALSKPVLGWGMDASRSIPEGRERVVIENCQYLGEAAKVRNLGRALPLHPHNAALQLWLELGLLGVAMTFGVLIVLVARTRKKFASPLGQAMFAGLFITTFVIYNIGFGLWQSWLIFALMLTAATMRSLLPDRSNTDTVPAEQQGS